MSTSRDSLTKTEEWALNLWRRKYGTEPKEPLRSKGGALDPNGWCMGEALRIVHLTNKGDDK